MIAGTNGSWWGMESVLKMVVVWLKKELQCGGSSSFRVTTSNAGHKVCESYPSSFVVPANVDDDDVVASAAFRSHGRVIACVFYDKVNRLMFDLISCD